MGERKLEDGRSLWLPILVGLIGALTAMAGWGLLVADRRASILQATDATAAETSDALERRFAGKVESIRQLGELWSEFGVGELPEWRSAVGQRLERETGLTTIVGIDLATSRTLFSVGQERSSDESRQDVAFAASAAEQLVLRGPERGAAGESTYRVGMPVPGRNAVLIGRFRLEPFLEAALQARARGYALTVQWGGEQIFAKGDPSTDPWQKWWRVEETVELPLGESWRIVYRPTPDFAAATLTALPHYLLAAGLVLSLVVAVAARQLQVIMRQARFVEAINRGLEERGQELEARVAQRTGDLEEAVKELEAFNYSVSHDLRSPLGAILNFTTILEEDYTDRPLNEQGVQILRRMRRSALRATALLEGLLQLSRAGRVSMAPEDLDMTRLAQDAFSQVRNEEPDTRDVEFVVEPLPMARGTRALMGDVFANLIGNALKYSRGCPKRQITVRGYLKQEEAIYEVHDTGQGFDMRFVDKLFVMFERLHSADEIEGTGVGLAMVARIIKRHGGRVWAEGRPGQGASFCFSLPQKKGV